MELRPPAPTGLKTVTATNNAGLPSSDTFTVTPDTSAPSGGSVSYANGYASGSVTVTTADGTDGGSGIDTSSRLIERDAVALNNGVVRLVHRLLDDGVEPGQHDRFRQLLRLPLHGRRQRRQPRHLHLAERGQGRHDRAERAHAFLRLLHERERDRLDRLLPDGRGGRVHRHRRCE